MPPSRCARESRRLHRPERSVVIRVGYVAGQPPLMADLVYGYARWGRPATGCHRRHDYRELRTTPPAADRAAVGRCADRLDREPRRGSDPRGGRRHRAPRRQRIEALRPSSPSLPARPATGACRTPRSPAERPHVNRITGPCDRTGAGLRVHERFTASLANVRRLADSSGAGRQLPAFRPAAHGHPPPGDTDRWTASTGGYPDVVHGTQRHYLSARCRFRWLAFVNGMRAAAQTPGS